MRANYKSMFYPQSNRMCYGAIIPEDIIIYNILSANKNYRFHALQLGIIQALVVQMCSQSLDRSRACDNHKWRKILHIEFFK